MKLLLAAASLAVVSALDSATASPTDLARAYRKVPGHAFLGDDIASMNRALNEQLTQKYGDVTKDCEDFTAEDLQFLQIKMHGMADPTLLKIYDRVDVDLPSSGRRRTDETVDDLMMAYEAIAPVLADPALHAVYRDGLCHQTVMWFIHHLSESSRTQLAQATKIPLLPHSAHDAPEQPTEAQAQAHRLYDTHTTCQACHTAGIANQGAMDPPLTPDPKHPGWDRIRRCDAACTGDASDGCVQYDPPCGACDGTGGPYWGDQLDHFTPVNCKVLQTADEVAEEDRMPPLLPKQFKVQLRGTDRLIRKQNPTNGTLYSNIHGQMYVDEDRADGNFNLRHDSYYERFTWLGHGHATEIHFQTQGMMHNNVTGPMWSTIEALKPFQNIPKMGYCTCVPDPVGVPHWDAFKDAQYMGRISLDPIEYLNKTVTVDHWAKWFFHMFVDADKESETYGKVLRFYSPYAGFAVYSDWQLIAPEKIWPEVWTDSLPSKGPSKCMNVKKVDGLCDVFYPTDATPSKAAPKVDMMNLRHPLMPSSMGNFEF